MSARCGECSLQGLRHLNPPLKPPLKTPPSCALAVQMREVLNAGLRLPVELPELDELRGEIKR